MNLLNQYINLLIDTDNKIKIQEIKDDIEADYYLGSLTKEEFNKLETLYSLCYI